MSTQSGTYFLGTYGFPISIETGTPLTGATSVSLAMTKPDGTVINRDLDLTAITDETAGIVTIRPLQAEVDLSGIYRFAVTVGFTTPDSEIVSAGQFTVEGTGMDGPGTLSVEDGTGLADANSYASVAEADAYHDGHLYADAWKSANARTKATALRMATRVIENAVLWTGIKKTTTQSLGWPRVYAPQVELPFSGWSWSGWGTFYRYYDSNSVPPAIKDATCELARELLKSDRTDEPEGRGIKSTTVGPISVTFDASDRPQLMPRMVRLMLRPFGSLLTSKRRSVPVRRV